MGLFVAVCRTLVVKKKMVEILSLSADATTRWSASDCFSLYGFLMSLDILSERKGSESNISSLRYLRPPRSLLVDLKPTFLWWGDCFHCQMTSKSFSVGQKEQTQSKWLGVEIRAGRDCSLPWAKQTQLGEISIIYYVLIIEQDNGK